MSTFLEVLEESRKQRKKDRKSPYGRIRLDGEDVRLHVAVKATGKTVRELLALKQKPIQEREKKEKALGNKVREWLRKNKGKDIDHLNGDKNNNSPSNLKPLDKPKHTIKTNSTR